MQILLLILSELKKKQFSHSLSPKNKILWNLSGLASLPGVNKYWQTLNTNPQLNSKVTFLSAEDSRYIRITASPLKYTPYNESMHGQKAEVLAFLPPFPARTPLSSLTPAPHRLQNAKRQACMSLVVGSGVLKQENSTNVQDREHYCKECFLNRFGLLGENTNCCRTFEICESLKSFFTNTSLTKMVLVKKKYLGNQKRFFYGITLENHQKRLKHLKKRHKENSENEFVRLSVSFQTPDVLRI